MNRRDKFMVLVVLVVSLIFTNINSLNASDGEYYLPTPMNTQEVNRDARKVAGSEFEFIFYSSSLSIKELTDFYRARLPALGWREEKLLDYTKLSGVKIDPTVSKTLSQSLLFKKDNHMITINFMPETIAKGKETLFTLTIGKMNLEAVKTPGADLTPELLAEPKKDVAPVYPGASLISLTEDEQFHQASYYTKDDIDPVAYFYKSKMSGYGWYLVEETPTTRKGLADFAGNYDISDYCPNCPKEIESAVKSMEVLFKEIKFSNQYGDKCIIGISRTTTGGEGMNMTTISVNYAEKK